MKRTPKVQCEEQDMLTNSKGKCPYGDSCMFSHDRDVGGRGKKRVCFQFQSGECNMWTR